jgi:TonB family protein
VLNFRRYSLLFGTAVELERKCIVTSLKTSNFATIVAVLVFAFISLGQLPCCGAEGDKSDLNCDMAIRSPDSRPVQNVGDSEVLRGYKRGISHRIMRCWYPPKDGRHAVVRFYLNRKGEVSGLGLSVSSGDKFSDGAALNAVKHAQPFRAIPKQLPAPLEAEFNFKIYDDRNSLQKPPGLTLRAREVKN